MARYIAEEVFWHIRDKANVMLDYEWWSGISESNLMQENNQYIEVKLELASI